MTVSKLPRLRPRAAVDDLTLIVPLVLQEPQCAAVLQFVDSYEHYRIEGGKNQVRKCVMSDILKMLAYMGIDVKDKAADDDKNGGRMMIASSQELQALFAPISIDDVYASLEAVVMKLKKLACELVKRAKELKAASAMTEQYDETDGSDRPRRGKDEAKAATSLVRRTRQTAATGRVLKTRQTAETDLMLRTRQTAETGLMFSHHTAAVEAAAVEAGVAMVEWPMVLPSEWPTDGLMRQPSEWPTEWPIVLPSEWPTDGLMDQPSEWPTEQPTERLERQ